MLNCFAILFDKLVLQRPWLTLLLLASVVGFFGYYAQDFKLDASADSLLLENDQDLRLYRQVTERYRSKEFLFVTFTPKEDFLSDNTLRHIDDLATELRRLPRIDSVLSVVDVPLVRNIDGPLSALKENIRTLKSEDVDKDLARKELLESPIYKNLVVSADGKTTALIIYLKDDPRFLELRTKRDQLLVKKYDKSLNVSEQRALAEINAEYDPVTKALGAERHRDIETIRGILDRYRGYGLLHLGGVPMIADDMMTFIKNDLMVFGTGVFIFLVVMLSIIFRRMRWVLLPLASCVFSVFLMIGVLGFIGWRVTVISSNFISLMLIITMSMNIHLVVRYRQLNRDNPDASQGDLVLMTAKKMVWPCLYTSLTTIMAFLSLLVSDIKPVIDFGWMMTIGLITVFLTSFLLFPSLLMVLKKVPSPPLTHRFSIAGALATIADVHGNKVLVLSLVLVVLSMIGVTRLQVENSFINYFSEDTEIHQGMKLIDEQLGGTTPLDIIIRFEPTDVGPGTDTDDELDEDFAELQELWGQDETGKADYWFTPYKVDLIKRIHDYLNGLPEVGKVLSLASGIRVAEGINKGEFDSLELAVLYKRMPDEIKTSMIDPYVSVEQDEARINLRILDSRENLRRKELLEKIESDLKGSLGVPEKDVQLTGVLVLYNNMLQSLFQSQILTLGLVMLGITIMLLVLFRSPALAIIGIVPNLLAAITILGLMGLLGIPLDMMTITIAAITIGIAVDNSIHYIYRFREELPNSDDYTKTLYHCHANIGRAVTYTAVTIIIGFSILSLSNFIPTIYFGVLTALAMFIALLAALTLLPRLILLWKPF